MSDIQQEPTSRRASGPKSRPRSKRRHPGSVQRHAQAVRAADPNAEEVILTHRPGRPGPKPADPRKGVFPIDRKKHSEVRLFEFEGHYIKERAEDENFCRYWYVEEDKRTHRKTLGTKDFEEAKKRLRQIVFSLGDDKAGRGGDPLVVAVMANKRDKLVGRKHSWRCQLERLIKATNETLPGIKMSELTGEKQDQLILSVKDRWDVNSVRNALKALSSSVTDACRPDKKGHIFSAHRPKINMKIEDICVLLRRPKPKPKNWSPDFPGMARIVRDLLSYNHEGVRRWVILALYTGCRPDAITEFNHLMIESSWNKHIFRSERNEETSVIKPMSDDDYRIFLQADNKRRPVLPLPQFFYDEFVTWGDGLWVGIAVDTVRGYLERTALKLNMPELWLSTFRDFLPVAMRHTHIWLDGREVSINETEIWQGHDVASPQHMRYGYFDPDYLRTAADAVELYVRWLDGQCDGKLFRRVTVGSATAGSITAVDDIASKEDAGVQAAGCLDVVELPPEEPAIDNALSDLEIDASDADAAPKSGLPVVPLSTKDDPLRLILPEVASHGADDWHRGSPRETTGLAGLRMHETGQIEGFKGLFRRVTDGREGGIWGDEFKRVGAKHVLPNITAWFRVEGIQIYDTDVSCKDIQPTRLFIDTAKFIVIDVSEISARMIVSLGRELVGWRDHSSLLEASSEYNNKSALEYRDPREEGQIPRGLLELIGPHSVLGNVRDIPRWFEEVPVVPIQQPLKGNKIDWRYMLRNLQCFFDINHIGVYEADLRINRELRRMRLFADSHTEKVLEVAYVRSVMLAQLGCDPGGWAEHSSKNEVSNFNVEEFICTTPLAACLDKSDKFEGDDGFDIAVGWH